MRTIRHSQVTVSGFHARAGLFAVTEISVVVLTLSLVLWGSSLLLQESGQPALAAIARACSDRPVYRLSINETGKQLWVFRRASEVTLLNLETERIVDTRQSAGVDLLTVAHSHDGSTSILVGHDNTLALMRAGNEPLFAMLPFGKGATSAEATVANDGRIALFARSDGYIAGWNSFGAQPEAISYRLFHSARLDRASLNAGGTLFFAAFSDKTVRVYEPTTGKGLSEPFKLPDVCTAMAWAADGRHLALALANGIVGLFDSFTGQWEWKASTNANQTMTRVISVAISSDGNWVAAAGFSSQLIIWNVNNPETVRHLSGHDGLIRALTFSPNNKSLFSGGLDGTIREWSMESFIQTRKFD